MRKSKPPVQLSKKLLSVREAAAFLGVHPIQLRRMVYAQKIDVYRIPGRCQRKMLRFDPEDLRQQLLECKVQRHKG